MTLARFSIALLVAALSSGCVSQQTKTDDSSAAAKPVDKKEVPAKIEAKSTAGLNDKGEVIDSSKVESGSGIAVKGINGTDGEITGKAAPKSKFAKLQIGMTMKQVTDAIGQPSDQGNYMTAKAWIPFYFGADRHRYELVYKDSGRLIIAGSGGFDWGNGHLIWIIHNKNEGAKR